jgi:hypothetical protein
MVMCPVKFPRPLAQTLLGLGLSLGLVTLAGSSPAISEDVAHLPEGPAVSSLSTPSLQQLQATLLNLEQMPLGMNAEGEVQFEEYRIAESLLAPGTQHPTITHTSLSEKHMTTPSLWWQQIQSSEIVGSDRLILGWSAYDRTGHTLDNIDVMVNGQIWNLLNYLERYSVIKPVRSNRKILWLSPANFCRRSTDRSLHL